MTVHQQVKAKLIEEGFTPAEAKAIIAICLAFPRAAAYRQYWDGHTDIMPPEMRQPFAQQVAAIARAYQQTFSSRKENELAGL